MHLLGKLTIKKCTYLESAPNGKSSLFKKAFVMKKRLHFLQKVIMILMPVSPHIDNF